MTTPEHTLRPSGPTLTQRAWGVAGATVLLAAFTSGGALLSGVPGERRGGAELAAFLLAGLAIGATLRFRPRPMTWLLFGLAAGQVGWGLLLRYQRIGSTPVVATLTVIFGAGWVIAALLLVAGQRMVSRDSAAA